MVSVPVLLGQHVLPAVVAAGVVHDGAQHRAAGEEDVVAVLVPDGLAVLVPGQHAVALVVKGVEAGGIGEVLDGHVGQIAGHDVVQPVFGLHLSAVVDDGQHMVIQLLGADAAVFVLRQGVQQLRRAHQPSVAAVRGGVVVVLVEAVGHHGAGRIMHGIGLKPDMVGVCADIGVAAVKETLAHKVVSALGFLQRDDDGGLVLVNEIVLRCVDDFQRVRSLSQKCGVGAAVGDPRVHGLPVLVPDLNGDAAGKRAGVVIDADNDGLFNGGAAVGWLGQGRYRRAERKKQHKAQEQTEPFFHDDDLLT